MSKFQAVMSDHTLNLCDFLRNAAAYEIMFQTDAHGKERCCCHICLHVDSKKPQFLPLVIQSQSPLFHGPSTHFLHLAQRRTHALLISFKSENQSYEMQAQRLCVITLLLQCSNRPPKKAVTCNDIKEFLHCKCLKADPSHYIFSGTFQRQQDCNV